MSKMIYYPLDKISDLDLLSMRKIFMNHYLDAKGKLIQAREKLVKVQNELETPVRMIVMYVTNKDRLESADKSISEIDIELRRRGMWQNATVEERA